MRYKIVWYLLDEDGNTVYHSIYTRWQETVLAIIELLKPLNIQELVIQRNAENSEDMPVRYHNITFVDGQEVDA